MAVGTVVRKLLSILSITGTISVRVVMDYLIMEEIGNAPLYILPERNTSP
jgi:hypothetical protein